MALVKKVDTPNKVVTPQSSTSRNHKLPIKMHTDSIIGPQIGGQVEEESFKMIVRESAKIP